jgi:hypothetical protein
MSTRAIGLLGLAAFGLIVVGGLIQPLWLFPGTGASGREIAAYVGAHRGGAIASVFVFGLGMGGFLAFAAALWAWLRRRPRVPGSLAAIFVFGAASLCTVVFAGFAVFFALAYRAPSVVAPRELYDVCFALLALSGIPTALALGAYAAIVFTASPLPAWSAWVAVVGAAAHLLIAASFFSKSGFFSLEGGVIVAIPTTMFLWLLAASVCLLSVRAEASPASP